jgi:REP element-mobilizing transposase RayT
MSIGRSAGFQPAFLRNISSGIETICLMKENPLYNSPGWRSRGYLPHLDRPDLIQLVTIRLYDAVPEALIDNCKKELSWTEKMPKRDPRRRALQKRIEKYEDAGHGACWLRDDRIGEMVESSLLYFNGKRYRLLAWCIMPNHVHSVIEIWKNHSLEEVMHSLKSYTANEANKILKRCGKFWLREYFDRYIRDGRHLELAVEYIESNPVKAHLVPVKEVWKWSSVKLHKPR